MEVSERQRLGKVDAIAALEEIIKVIKNANIEDVELDCSSECPVFGEFPDSNGIIRVVPGAVVQHEIKLAFKL